MAGALLVGGDGDDRLAISGAVGQGAWLFGGNGDDDLTAGPGADRVDGGAGADVLRTARRPPGRRSSAAPRPTASTPTTRHVVAADCEQRARRARRARARRRPAPADRPDARAAARARRRPRRRRPSTSRPAPVTLSHGAVPMRVSCTAATALHAARSSSGCSRAARGHEAVAAGARRPVIARRRYRVGAGHSKTLRVHISRRGRVRGARAPQGALLGAHQHRGAGRHDAGAQAQDHDRGRRREMRMMAPEGGRGVRLLALAGVAGLVVYLAQSLAPGAVRRRGDRVRRGGPLPGARGGGRRARRGPRRALAARPARVGRRRGRHARLGGRRRGRRARRRRGRRSRPSPTCSGSPSTRPPT